MLVVIDAFLGSESEFFKELSDESIWTDFDLDSFWLPKDKEPENIFEQLITKIWYEVAPGILPSDFDGFEHWRNELSVNSTYGSNLGWHRDKDERHLNKTGETNHPYIGSVYYTHTEIPIGGFLEVDREESGENEVERIQPVPDRLILFDSASWHRVTDVTKGPRRHIASNLWLKKPDEDNFKRERY